MMPPPFVFIWAMEALHAVVNALYVHAKNLIEIVFSSSFQVADMRNSGVVDQNMHTPLLENLTEGCIDTFRLRDVAVVGLGVATLGDDPACHLGSCLFVDVEHADAGAITGKALRHRAPDAAGAASHHRQLAVQAERIGITRQKMPPSFYAFTSAYLDCSFAMRSNIAKAFCASASSGANASAVCNSFSASPILPVRW